MRRYTCAGAALLAFSCVATAFAMPNKGVRADAARRRAFHYYGAEIARFERQTWHWQRVMGVRLTPPARMLSDARATAVRHVAAAWERRSAHAYRAAQHPPRLGAWLCIHRYEGSWTDGGAPYYGGLQMDLGFQSHYAPWLLRQKGTADHWTPLEQIWTAVRASRTRGFYPWPNTARLCGLL